MKLQDIPARGTKGLSAMKVRSYVLSTKCTRAWPDRTRVLCCVFLGLTLATIGATCLGQASLPFGVSNLKHEKLPADEATRIYFSACSHVARAIRPENPPHLRPKFVLVLGAQDNQTVRADGAAEVRLKTWNPAAFAEAVVIMAAREVLDSKEVTNLTRDTLLSAQASVSVSDLKQGR
jgi:hypothetical protein